MKGIEKICKERLKYYLFAMAILTTGTKSIEIPRFTTLCEAYLRNLQQIYNKIELLHEKKNREVKLHMISLFI